ncbi:hypothetical protein SAMN05518872_109150 [Psychrobacillus sp. OK032]|nr:hypothetical protein SAMN05518872_109150 [Psychrobacillus sp. OK032]
MKRCITFIVAFLLVIVPNPSVCSRQENEDEVGLQSAPHPAAKQA